MSKLDDRSGSWCQVKCEKVSEGSRRGGLVLTFNCGEISALCSAFDRSSGHVMVLDTQRL